MSLDFSVGEISEYYRLNMQRICSLGYNSASKIYCRTLCLQEQK